MYDDYTGDYIDEKPHVKRFYKPPSEVKDYAICYVLGDEVSSSLKEELNSYIDNRFENIGTCILWNKTPELNKILKKHGVTIDSKEAIIKSDAVLTTKDKRFAPRLTFSI